MRLSKLRPVHLQHYELASKHRGNTSIQVVKEKDLSEVVTCHKSCSMETL